MSETPIDESAPPRPDKATEYGDAIIDVLKDQVRRDELRSAAAPKVGRTRVHPFIPPILALFSIWLWVFPPEVLIPEVPIIPLAHLEAGIRMEMIVQRARIIGYRMEHGRLPTSLEEAGERSTSVEYTRLGDDVFQLSGTNGDFTLRYNSTQPEEELLGDSKAIVSGISSTPVGAGSS